MVISNLGYEGFPQRGQGQTGDRYGAKDIAINMVKKALDREQKRLAKVTSKNVEQNRTTQKVAMTEAEAELFGEMKESEEKYWAATMKVPIDVKGVPMIWFVTTRSQIKANAIPKLSMLLNDKHEFLGQFGGKVGWQSKVTYVSNYFDTASGLSS